MSYMVGTRLMPDNTLRGFASELVKLSERLTSVQRTPSEGPKLGPGFKQLTPQQQKTELAAPGAYTHRATPAPEPIPKFLTPGAWTSKEIKDIRQGTSPIGKAQAKPATKPAVVASR